MTIKPLTMTGMARGANRAILRASAEEQAKKFFGLDCISVEMLEAEQVAPEVFRATFRARESHRVQSPSYGPSRCVDCRRERYPHEEAIPVADWRS